MKAKPHILARLTKVLLIIFGIYLALCILGLVIAFVTRVHITYSLKKLDCSQSAKLQRNQAAGRADDACLIRLTLVNQKNNSEYLDLADIGGGPANFHSEPSVRIYDARGRFCHALPLIDKQRINEYGVDKSGVNEGGNIELRPKGRADITLRCIDNDNLHIDSRPVYIIIDYDYSKTRLDLARH